MTEKPTVGLVALMYIIYGLHLFSAITGVLSPAFIVTAFLSGWPSIIALILSYAKQDEAANSYLASHFRWTIRTFWLAFMWLVLSGLLFITAIGIPIALLILLVTGFWVLYRMTRGVLSLLSEQPMAMQ
jgi:uncharacterized membrane protein